MKLWTIVHGFRPENENFDFGKKMIASERAFQEEQNGANISFIAPSSEELWQIMPYTILATSCATTLHAAAYLC